MTIFLQILAVFLVIRAVWRVIRMALYTSPVSASYNGFRIQVPQALKDALSPRELEAVVCHEEGHKHHLHPWVNYLRWLFFWPSCQEELEVQEMQADNYAAERGHALTLSAALRKRAGCRFDVERADRLEMLGVAELKRA